MGRVPCTLPEDVVETFTDCQRGDPEALDCDLCFDGDWCNPQYVKDTLLSVEADLRNARLLHLEFGYNEIDPEVKKLIERTTTTKLQSFHLQARSWGPIVLHAPNLLHLSLDGVRSTDWTTTLPTTLTDIRLASLSIPLAALQRALRSCHHLESLVLDEVKLYVSSTDEPPEGVFAPRLKDVKIHMCDPERTMAVLDMLRLDEIHSVEVAISGEYLSPATRRVIDAVVNPPRDAKVQRLRYFGENVEFGIGPLDKARSELVRRFAPVRSYDLAMLLLKYLQRQHSIYTTLKDVTIEVNRFWALALVGDTLANVVNLQISRGNSEQTVARVLEWYAFDNYPFKITFPRLRHIYLHDHDADDDALGDTIVTGLLKRLGCDDVLVEEAFYRQRAEQYPSTCEAYLPPNFPDL